MNPDDNTGRRAGFGNLWKADEAARSLAHGLELEDEAEQEEAVFAPGTGRRTTGRFVAMSAIAVFVVSTLGLGAVLADQFEAEAFMRDHGVAVQAVITDSVYSPWAPRIRTSFGLGYRFWPRPSTDPSVDGYETVSWRRYASVRVGQVVTVRYNPQRLSQSRIDFDPPPTDGQMLAGDAEVLGIWVVLFGGLCTMIVGLAWPKKPASERLGARAWR